MAEQTKPEPTYLTPDPDSKLAHLIARRAVLSPVVKQAQDELDEITAAIKVELSTAAPESEDTRAGGLRMFWKVSRRLNQKRLKELVGPEVFDQLREESGAWTLVETSG